MPSPQAQAATAAHRRELALLAAALTRRVNRVALAADTTDIDRWWARAEPEVVRLVAAGHDAAAAMARRYLATHAAVEGVVLDPVRVGANRAEIATSLHVTGPVAFKTNMRISEDPAVARRVMGSMLSGSAQRLTLNGDRSTIMRTFTESGAITGWRRVGAGSCAFCAMLLSRGAVYSKTTVDFHAHDSCVTGSTSVRGPRFEAGFRRWYEGEVVVIGLPGGDELTITPKHPVLTDRGWVDADDLRDTDQLVHGASGDLDPAAVPHEHQVPSAIEDVWRSFRMHGLRRVPVAAKNFHGDGRGTKGDVDVVAPDGLLANVRDTTLIQYLAQVVGAGAGSPPVSHSLAGSGDAASVLLGLGDPTRGLVCCGGEGLALLTRQAAHPGAIDLGHSSALDTGFDQPPLDDRPGYAEPGGDGELGFPGQVVGGDVDGWFDAPVAGAALQGPRFDPPPEQELPGRLGPETDLGARLLERLAGQVELLRPVELRRIGRWSGHVYNLQTAEGWYEANGVVVSNCKCSAEPLYEREPEPEQVRRLQEQWAQATAGKSGKDALRAFREFRDQAASA